MTASYQLVPYRKEHVLPMLEQPINADLRGEYLSGLAELLESQASFTALVHHKPMVCGGVIKLWEGRGCVWTVFNEDARQCFVPVFRGIRRFLQDQMKIYRRLELAVPISFEIGHRRAKLLGFKVECHFAQKFLPNGDDCVLYSMVRGD